MSCGFVFSQKETQKPSLPKYGARGHNVWSSRIKFSTQFVAGGWLHTRSIIIIFHSHMRVLTNWQVNNSLLMSSTINHLSTRATRRRRRSSPIYSRIRFSWSPSLQLFLELNLSFLVVSLTVNSSPGFWVKCEKRMGWAEPVPKMCINQYGERDWRSWWLCQKTLVGIYKTCQLSRDEPKTNIIILLLIWVPLILASWM